MSIKILYRDIVKHPVYYKYATYNVLYYNVISLYYYQKWDDNSTFYTTIAQLSIFIIISTFPLSNIILWLLPSRDF